MSPQKSLIVLVLLVLFAFGLSLYVHAIDGRRYLRNKSAHAEGRSARRRGCSRDWNPFILGSDAAETWCDGYDTEDRIQRREESQS